MGESLRGLRLRLERRCWVVGGLRLLRPCLLLLPLRLRLGLRLGLGLLLRLLLRLRLRLRLGLLLLLLRLLRLRLLLRQLLRLGELRLLQLPLRLLLGRPLGLLGLLRLTLACLACSLLLRRPARGLGSLRRLLSAKRRARGAMAGAEATNHPAEAVMAPGVPSSPAPDAAIRPEDPPAVTQAVGWLYIDLERTVQGPFTSEEVVAWYAAGYLPPELLLRRTGPGGPHSFREVRGPGSHVGTRRRRRRPRCVPRTV